MALVRVHARGIERHAPRRVPESSRSFDGDNIYNRRDSPFISTWSSPPKRSTEEWLETYGRSPRLSVVNKIAEDLSFATGRLIYRHPDGTDEDVPETHPFWKFWNEPNPMPQFTSEAIWQLHQEYLLLTGEGYMVIEKDQNGYPAELWPIPPNWVMTTPTAGNAYYTIRTPSNLIAQVHFGDMFIQMELNPADPYGRGLGRAQSIADEVEIDEYAAAFEKRFFYNDATPNSVISIEGADAEAVKRFGADWNNTHRGVANSHRTAVTSGKVSAVKLADNMKDLDMISGRVFLRDSVLEHFHMPREIMGITENSNRATAESAQYIYAQNVQTPYIRKRQSAINIQLVPYWGDDLRFEYDEIIPRNQEFDKTVALEGWNAGLLMKNESREKLDMPPVDNGNIYYAAPLFGYVGEDQDLTQSSAISDIGGNPDYYDQIYEEADPDTGRKEYKARISQIDMQAIQQLERAQRQQERHAENVTAQHFSRQRREILRAFRDCAKTGKSEAAAGSDFDQLRARLEEITSPISRMEIIAGFVERMADWQEDETRLREILSNIWSQSYDQSQGIMDKLYDLHNPRKPETRDVFKRMGGQRIASDISGTTKQSIVDIIDRGLADGLDVSELAGKIGSSADVGPYRAKLIAQQETYNAMSASNYDTMKDGGVVRRKWVTRGDDIVRPTHKRLNGQIRNINEPFSNGLMHPHDTNGPASETLWCRCWEVPLRERQEPLLQTTGAKGWWKSIWRKWKKSRFK